MMISLVLRQPFQIVNLIYAKMGNGKAADFIVDLEVALLDFRKIILVNRSHQDVQYNIKDELFSTVSLALEIRDTDRRVVARACEIQPR